MHVMSVKEKYYNMLKSGKKVIELRLLDDKRKSINIGDTIKFYNVSDENDNFQAIVTNLHKAPNFDKLCNIIEPIKAGFAHKEDLLKVLEEFYPVQKQNKIGVIGIEVAKIA